MGALFNISAIAMVVLGFAGVIVDSTELMLATIAIGVIPMAIIFRSIP